MLPTNLILIGFHVLSHTISSSPLILKFCQWRFVVQCDAVDQQTAVDQVTAIDQQTDVDEETDASEKGDNEECWKN